MKSKTFLIPTLCWVLFVVAVVIGLGADEGKHNSLARTLIQWDGQHYFSIAHNGYEVFPCPENPSYICGNAGWFPLYPLAAAMAGKLLVPLGLEMRWVMIITSLICFWLALLVLYRLVKMKYGQRVALWSILSLLLFPTSFYYATAFPYSLYLLLVTVVFSLLEEKRYLLVAIPAGLLAITYPSGIIIALPLGRMMLREWFDNRHFPAESSDRLVSQGKWTARWPALGVATITVGLALVAYFLYNWWQFDNFWLYFDFQAKPYYSHEPIFPLVSVVQSLIDLPLNNPVFIMLVFVIATTTVFYRRIIPVSWQLYMFGVLLFTPAAGTTDCYYRHIIVVFPLFVMIALAIETRRKWLLPLYGVTGLSLTWFVFLKAYKLGELM
ncbi:MAG: hypothetical protein KOO62_03095 [candidate division Zixibacteria bacterium]|nr:hypothetical protein [candidate division Zixibacteria bacterium]